MPARSVVFHMRPVYRPRRTHGNREGEAPAESRWCEIPISHPSSRGILSASRRDRNPGRSRVEKGFSTQQNLQSVEVEAGAMILSGTDNKPLTPVVLPVVLNYVERLDITGYAEKHNPDTPPGNVRQV